MLFALLSSPQNYSWIFYNLQNISLIINLVLLAATWLIWRLWRFTITPYLYPERVRELPYWIPMLGHTVSFFLNAPEVVNAGVQMTKSSEEPFMLQLIAVKLYFILKPHDISHAFRSITALSFDRFLDDYMVCFGVKREDVPAMNNNMITMDRILSDTYNYPAEGKNTKDFIQWAYIQQLSVDKIDELSCGYFRSLQETTDWDLLDCTLTISVTKMLFGDEILKIEPDIVKHVQGFIDNLWRLVYQYPKWLMPDRARSYEKTLDTLEALADAPSSQISDASWLVRTVMAGQVWNGLHKRSNAALLSVIYLAALANVHATSYWLLCYILSDEKLKAAIQEETKPAFQKGSFDTNYVVQNCPLIDSAFREVLRLHITSNTVRYVEDPTCFNEKILQPGNQIMIPLRQLSHSESIWGHNHNIFVANRFIKNKALATHPGYRPFGGGANLCPGKSYATRQVLSYIAYLLYTFEFNLPSKKGNQQPFPLVANNNLAFGVSIPKKGTDLDVQIKPSSNDPIYNIIFSTKPEGPSKGP